MQSHPTTTITGAALVAMLLLAACRPSGAPPADAPAAAATATALPAHALRERADRAMREQRVFAPAGDNALEHYLALRVQQPGDAGVLAALDDLQPLLVIAAEQAIARGEPAEAQRLVGLLRKTHAAAPALGRLQASADAAALIARERARAADAEAVARAEDAEAALRRQAEGNAPRIATAPVPATVAPAPASASPPSSPASTARAEPPPAASENAPAAAAAAPAAPARTATRTQPASVLPRLVRDVAPRYPEAAIGRRLSGEVQVAFTIAPNGDVESPQVVSSTLPNAFHRAALAAASRWKFEASATRHQSQRTVSFAYPGG